MFCKQGEPTHLVAHTHTHTINTEICICTHTHTHTYTSMHTYTYTDTQTSTHTGTQKGAIIYGGLNYNSQHRLIRLNTWPTVGRTFGEGLGGVTLFEEVFH